VNVKNYRAESKKQLDIIENLEMVIWDDISEINFKGYTVLVDAIFGIGLDRPAEGKYAETIQLMNEFQGYVFAVDIPSGISADNGQVLGHRCPGGCDHHFRDRKNRPAALPRFFAHRKIDCQ
jgi:NAD(P)H-hydrate repair Nnr-like enzyme with NAD(P)H-hydrate epimerase domain